MPIGCQNLKKNIIRAWDKALRRGAGATNRARAKIWVDEVAARFRVNYPGKRERVFWRGNPDPKTQTEFKKKEMLFDVMVCSIGTTESLERHPRPLAFIAHCHWQVESEFSTDTRDLVIDMSKLVAGSADHKLMIAAHRKTADQTQILLGRCAKIAACCGGQVYFCFAAHPHEWDSSPRGPVVYEYTVGNWRELG